jgi:urease accessory protein
MRPASGAEDPTTVTITAPEATGSAGRLAADAVLAEGRTVLRSLRTEGTLKAMRIHHLDPALPGMGFLTIASPGGGVLQGDRLEVAISVGEGALLNIGTTSATRIYAMPKGQAEADTRLEVARGAYAEYLPDPFIPYARSRYLGHSHHVVADGATLLVAEVVGPGRQARGESLAYDLFQSETEVRRPDGKLLFRDTTRLCPGEGLTSPGLLGPWQALGVLYAVAQGLDASVFEAAMVDSEQRDLYAGCSELPHQAGAWFRVLAADAPAAQSAVRAAWATVRQRLLGTALPPIRRY